jgi:uncharacterized membrane protein
VQQQSPANTNPYRTPESGKFVDALNAFARWFNRHWLAIVVGIILVYGLLPFGAPVLMKAGLTNAAQWIYQPYKLVCHTYAFRSFFLFGEQLVYPRGNGDGVFERATGIADTPAGLLQAREFQGNEQLGYKVAICERDIAIYLALAVNGIAFAFTRRRARPLPWLWFILIGIVPIGIDGFAQLFSQWPFNFVPFYESSWVLRVITGSLFGFSVAWLVFPLIEGTMRGMRSNA